MAGEIRTADVVVVGGGILGAAIAFALAGKGVGKIVVLENETALGQHSTARSVGYFIPMYESIAFADLAQASVGFLRKPPEDFSARPVFRQDGALIASIDSGMPAFLDEVRQARSLGVEIQELSSAELHRMIPIVKAECFQAAAFYPTAGEIDVDTLLAGFVEGAQRKGVRFLTQCRFLAATTIDGRVRGARTSAGEIACDHIVNAAGAWAGFVGRQCGASDIEFKALRRHIVALPLPDHEPSPRWPFFRCPSIPMFLKPRGNRLLVSPMDVSVDFPRDCPVDRAMVRAAIDSIDRYTTFEMRGAHTAIAGHRCFSASRLPVVGPDEILCGFHWAAGLGGAGIMAAPAVAEIVAEGILRGVQPEAWKEVAPSRSTAGATDA